MEFSQFKLKSPVPEKLLAYGFSERGEYVTDILNGQFVLTVKIKDAEISTTLTDVSTGEPYTLHLVEDACGAFVGSVRAEFDAVLSDIAEKCFVTDTFKGDTAHKVIEYIRDKYGDELEYLWENFPTDAIWRRKDNRKWYGLMVVLSKRKLGLDSDEPVTIMDFRMKPEEIAVAVDNKKYFAGYHMNKNHWVTVRLDGSVPVGEIFKRIDESYALAKKSK